MSSYGINITGHVPVIQWVKDGVVFSNDPDGFRLWAVGPETRRVILHIVGPVSDLTAPTIEPGEAYEFTKRG